MRKIYNIKGIYTVEGGTESISWEVNGVESPLPPQLTRWIARDFIMELFYKNSEITEE